MPDFPSRAALSIDFSVGSRILFLAGNVVLIFFEFWDQKVFGFRLRSIPQAELGSFHLWIRVSSPCLGPHIPAVFSQILTVASPNFLVGFVAPQFFSTRFRSIPQAELGSFHLWIPVSSPCVGTAYSDRLFSSLPASNYQLSLLLPCPPYQPSRLPIFLRRNLRTPCPQPTPKFKPRLFPLAQLSRRTVARLK